MQETIVSQTIVSQSFDELLYVFVYIRHLFHLAKVRLLVSVVFTGAVGFSMAPLHPIDGSRLSLILSVLFIIGVSASLMNNLIDYSMDKKMPRTQERSTMIDSLGKNLLWGISLIFLFVGILITYLFFDLLTLGLLLFSFFSYVIWYTLFLKRKNAFGVILGGLPGALPLLIGYASTEAKFSMVILFMFLYMMLWQPPHFWLLSLVLKEDYKRGGVPTLPLVYGDTVTKYFIYIYSLSLLPISLFTCFLVNSSLLAYIIVFSLGAYFLFMVIQSLEKTKNYRQGFRSSIIYMLGYMFTFFFDSIFFLKR